MEGTDLQRIDVGHRLYGGDKVVKLGDRGKTLEQGEITNRSPGDTYLEPVYEIPDRVEM